MTLLAALMYAAMVIVLLAPRPAWNRLNSVLEHSELNRSELNRSELKRSESVYAHPDPQRGRLSQLPKTPRLASRRARLIASAGAGLGTWSFTGGWFAPVAGCVVAALAWILLGRLVTQRTPPQSMVVTALAANLLLAAIRAGGSPVTAAEIVGSAVGGPLGRALIADGSAARMGAGASSWRALHDNPRSRPLGRALRASLSHGTSPGPALERVARDARDGSRWEGEAKARAVGARAAAPLGLCFLPAFVLVAIVPIVVASFS